MLVNSEVLTSANQETRKAALSSSFPVDSVIDHAKAIILDLSLDTDCKTAE